MIKLSVIVPCHQVEPYLRQTLTSLGRNLSAGMELILVDDGSSDATPMIMDEMARALPETTIITHRTARGVSAARNAGLDAARGAYLTFLDGDDWYAPGYLTTLLATIERLGCELVRTDHVRVTGRRRVVHRIPYGPRNRVGRPRDAILPADRSTSVDAPNAWAGIYSRRLLDAGLLHFDEDLHTCEDRLWTWRLHLHAKSFAVVGLAGVFYRRDVSTSLTQLTDERQLDFLTAFDRVVAEVQADRDSARLLPKALRSYAAMACYHLERRPLYARPLADAVLERCRAGLRALPRTELSAVVRDLDPERRKRLERLVAA